MSEVSTLALVLQALAIARRERQRAEYAGDVANSRHWQSIIQLLWTEDVDTAQGVLDDEAKAGCCQACNGMGCHACGYVGVAE